MSGSRSTIGRIKLTSLQDLVYLNVIQKVLTLYEKRGEGAKRKERIHSMILGVPTTSQAVVLLAKPPVY